MMVALIRCPSCGDLNFDVGASVCRYCEYDGCCVNCGDPILFPARSRSCSSHCEAALIEQEYADIGWDR